MRRLLAVVLAVLAAGCTALEAPAAHAPELAQVVEPAAAEHGALTAAESPPHRVLDVALSIPDRWIRPQDAVIANATSAPNARISWFLAARNPLVGANWPHTRPDIGPVPPITERAVAQLSDSGRYLFAARGGTLNVTVAGGLPPQADAIVDIIPTESGIRFVPDEAIAGRGGALILRNAASMDVQLVERDFLAALPVTGRSISFFMPRSIDLGDYDLTAFASDGAGSVGSASARIVFDVRKPDEAQVIGPYGGHLDITAPAPVGSAPVRYPFKAYFVMRDLEIVFNATAPTGLAAVRVALEGPDGKDVDVSEAGDHGALMLHGLPPGAYALRVEATEGALLSFAVEGRVRFALTTPASFFDR